MGYAPSVLELRALYLFIPHRILQAHDEALELATDCQTHESLSH